MISLPYERLYKVRVTYNGKGETVQIRTNPIHWVINNGEVEPCWNYTEVTAKTKAARRAFGHYASHAIATLKSKEITEHLEVEKTTGSFLTSEGKYIEGYAVVGTSDILVKHDNSTIHSLEKNVVPCESLIVVNTIMDKVIVKAGEVILVTTLKDGDRVGFVSNSLNLPLTPAMLSGL